MFKSVYVDVHVRVKIKIMEIVGVPMTADAIINYNKKYMEIKKKISIEHHNNRNALKFESKNNEEFFYTLNKTN